MKRRQINRFLLWGGTGLAASLTLRQWSDAQAVVPDNSELTTLMMPAKSETELLISTFLGNDQRCYYGQGVPTGLTLQHRFLLGTGVTNFQGSHRWSGAGWTGQPTLVRDREVLYLIIGAFNHELRKIRLPDFSVIWSYRFEDILKATATLYRDPTAPPEDQIVILQGSRLGVHRSPTSPVVPSLRAISFRTGKSLWQMNIPLTASYSRDHDGTPLYLGDRHAVFTAAENGMGYVLDGRVAATRQVQGLTQPTILAQVQLYQRDDVARQGGNLVTESSAARWQDHVYVTAGSGRVYGIDLKTRQIDWEYFVGTDMDGSPVIDRQGNLYCTVEKEYNAGFGGVLKLRPHQPQPVVWFLPTANARVASWLGGIIGSVALNDAYNPGGDRPRLFATLALDGYLYIGSQTQIVANKTVADPRLEAQYPTPLVPIRHKLVPSISTPIFTEGDRLIAAGYGGIYLFQLHFRPQSAATSTSLLNDHGEPFQLELEQLAVFGRHISFEATPIVWEGKVYIAARDGYLYCLAGA
ncbi:hypothetical protein [Parathermosynechococcus lividus]